MSTDLIIQRSLEYLESVAIYATPLLVALVLTLVLVPMVIKLAPRIGMVDLPDARRVHQTPTPRGGGMAVFFGVQIALGLTYWLGFAPESMRMGQGWWPSFLVASSVLFVVGVIDDSRGMRAWLKLGGQIAAATLFFLLNGGGFGGLLGFEVPWALDLVLTIVWCVAIINAFNLIDGLDGLCSGLALIGAVGMMVAFFIRRESVEALVPMALIGGCLGFLRYNFHPARIFLGDTGSMFLGFSLAAISLAAAGKTTFVVSVGVPLLVAGIPLFDTILAIWRRSVRKWNARADGASAGRVMGADKEHLHHRLLSRGFSQRKVVFILYGAGATLVLVSLVALGAQDKALGVYMLAFMGAVYVVVRHVAHAELWDTGMAIVRGLSRPGRDSIALGLFVAWDLMVMIAALMVAFLLMPIPAINASVGTREEFFVSFPLWITPVFLTLLMAQVYRREWSKAGLADFLALQLALAVGFSVVLALLVFDAGGFRRVDIVRLSIFSGWTYLGILAGRSFGQVLAAFLRIVDNRRSRWDQPAGSRPKRVLIYGTGERCLLFLKERSLQPLHRKGDLEVVGLLDPMPEMRLRLIKGFPVLGSLTNLSEVLAEHPVDEIVFCSLPSDEEKALAKAAQQAGGLQLSVWQCRLIPWDGSS